MTEYLDMEDLLDIAADAITGPVLVRDHGLLEAALARPQTTVFGADAYPTLLGKAAAFLHSLACNHALVDGNKRLAWHASFVFLDINGHRVLATQDEVVDLVTAVADGSLPDVDKIAERLGRLESDR
ncbi:MAG: type II toxin-antitoxin system death-on-curing family toxin [Pseudonocardiaceae bacterium]|nr:type II toxin-antitoxin system death-on-curing family toxin [Pseudonocardiaceae bacterium]